MSHLPHARTAAVLLSAAGLLAASAAWAQATPATPATPAAAATPAAPAVTASKPAASVRAAAALPSPVGLPARPSASRPPHPSSNARSNASPEEVFAGWDRDKNRALSIEEFRAGFDQMRMASMVSRLASGFRTADTSRNGKLEPAEYATLPLMKRAGKDAPPLATFDINKDGALDNQEYMKMVEALVRVAETQGG